jgi:DUF4097 and DUF4098 domain-containing protein YvlB
MNLFGLGALVALAALPVTAEEVDRTMDAAADGHVSIANTSGSVTVNGWSRDQVEVKGELGRNVEELIFESSGDGVRIHVKVPKNSGRGIASDLFIQVPQGSSLDVATVSADIDVTKVRGDQKLETVSGDIDTEAYAADISANVVSGDIEIRGEGSDTEIRVGTVSGDLELSGISGVVEGGTVTGDFAIDDGSFDRAALHTVNGELIFRSELRDGGTLEAEAVNGEIILQFDGEISGRFEFDTLNGDIDNCFGPEPKRTSKYTPGWTLRFQEGDGDARITASTVNGDISICR